MKKSYQNPISINSQIENLISLKLIVRNKKYAEDVLERISYYRLIKSYSATLKENGKYIDGTTFENIVELYKFDIEIRHILFLLIEHIEVYLRVVITNYFSLNYDFGEILLYAAIEVSSFGTLSKMYKNMKNYDKKEISKIFNVDYTYLESWIENIAYVRNICAHYGRLYGVKFIKMPKLYS